MTNKIKNTLSRTLRGLPPKYRGRKHETAYAHAKAWAAGEYSSCLEYYHPVDEIPSGAITIPYGEGKGKLAYVCPYAD